MSYKQLSLSIGTPLGNLEGIRLPGFFERKGEYIWVPFLDPENNKILGLGAIWNCGEGTGLFSVDIRLWCTKGPFIRPMCIGTVRARTHCRSINQSINQSRALLTERSVDFQSRVGAAGQKAS
jgi:hypothetical protein